MSADVGTLTRAPPCQRADMGTEGAKITQSFSYRTRERTKYLL